MNEPNLSHAPIDPQLVLPDAVRNAASNADAMIAALKNGTALTPPPQIAVQPPPQPGFESVEANLSHSSPTNPTPAPFEIGVQQPHQQQAPQSQEPPQNYEQLYRSLRGRQDNEIAQLRQSVQQAMDRNNQLEMLLANVGTQAPQRPNGNGRGHTVDEFTPEEIEQWGPETLDMLGRIIDRRAGRMAQQHVQPLVHDVEAQSQATMERYLDAEVPQWRQINFLPEFMNWALLPDAYTGVIRRDLLKRAYGAKNAPVVANFFRGFISEHSASPAHPQPPAGPAPVAPSQQGAPQPPASNRIALADLAAPTGAGGNGGGVPPPVVQKRMYRGSDIARFYNDRSLGRYNTPELRQQADQVERDIFAAQAEGRVLPG